MEESSPNETGGKQSSTSINGWQLIFNISRLNRENDLLRALIVSA